MKTETESILVLDSGIGGVPYLESIVAAMPWNNYIYLADTAFFPYGTKSHTALSQRVTDIVGCLTKRYHCAIGVIACNTASQAGLAQLRTAYPGIRFVGTVPAIKPAAKASLTKKIAILATHATLHDSYLDRLIQEHGEGVEVVRKDAQSLIAEIEMGLWKAEPEIRVHSVAPYVEELILAGVDQIVLGCTHFLLLAEDFKNVASGRAGIVDSCEGVTSRVRELCQVGNEQHGSSAKSYGSSHRHHIDYIVTGVSPNALHNSMAMQLGASFYVVNI